jgi:hypothetical protein
MGTIPPTPAEPPPPAGPLLGLLSRGLELWLRQQCEAIERLDIQLQGSAAQLVLGRLEGVRLLARRVVFRKLRFDRVELRSGPIQIRTGGLLRGQSLRLEQPFALQGTVAFTGDDLGRSLATPEWRSLADGLAEDILGLSPLSGLRIQEERLVLSATGAGSPTPVELATDVEAVDGRLELRSVDGGPVARLPMDPSIRIERAFLAAGLLQLEGEALVSP